MTFQGTIVPSAASQSRKSEGASSSTGRPAVVVGKAPALPYSSPHSGELSGLVDSGLSWQQQARRFPMLTPEEEAELTRRYAANGDRQALDRLVQSHLRLAVKMAMRFRNTGLPLEDLMAEASLGLVRAVQKFEPEKGVRLSSYAVWWIRATLHEYILNNWSLVKIGTAAVQKRLFYNLRKVRRQLGIADGASLSDDQAREIASLLEVRPQDVQSMNSRLYGRDLSLNVPVGEDLESERMDFLADDAASQEEQLSARQLQGQASSAVRQALELLDDRERQILVRRRLVERPDTLEELGERFNISRERVRQLENRAFGKVESRIRQLLPAGI